ncbi:hypothetical protein [Sphingobacterium faecium]|uniref:hypothetical protein n=1 Tax=Sphingobacterium faecium TaxID=34087 RepID=UPI0024693C80|nr:hypothetical protein [Sphingobacterium faecium]MDH5828799.1 hypothetical protein [Sphingobacterium faecium]
MNNESKKIYISPKVEMTTIELEQGIAAGSNPTNNKIQESWDNGEDDNRTFTL